MLNTDIVEHSITDRLFIQTQLGDLCISTILDCGFSPLNSGKNPDTTELHSHIYCELMAAFDGDYLIELTDKQKVVIPSGCFCLIPSGIHHSSRANSGSTKLALRFAVQKAEAPSGTCGLYALFSTLLGQNSAPRLFNDGGRICTLLSQIRGEFNTSRTASDEFVRVLFEEVYLCLMRTLETSAEPSQSGSSHFFIPEENDIRRMQIENYFLQHFGEPITEADLAREMNLSVRQLSRILKTLCGAGFRQLLIDIRLHQAARLLITTGLSIEEIASSVGYTSLSGIYSAFRNKFHMSMGQYREKMSTDSENRPSFSVILS